MYCDSPKTIARFKGPQLLVALLEQIPFKYEAEDLGTSP